MVITLIIVVSVISAILFDKLPVLKNARLILTLQKKSGRVLFNSKLSDGKKQQLLFFYAGIIFFTAIKVVILFAIILIPFISLVFIEWFVLKKNDYYEIIASLNGIALSVLSFIMYFIVKKTYENFRI